jgi:glutamyl-Q tRNA(Asp) synthetase
MNSQAKTALTPYRGRFAPSPTGPLHFGSLVAAVGSYLDAKAHGGAWLVRMEDVDTPRVAPGAADDILRTLERLGMHWDEPVMVQSRRSEAYHAALKQLEGRGALYPCACTRREIADSALHGVDGFVYSGVCRNGLPAGRAPRATRVRTAGACVSFADAIQGTLAQNVERDVGDFVVRRADGLFAYQLAVVVDDAAQGITDIVRGADLLDSTPRQIHLQRLLGVATPRYAHLPVAVNPRGEKLSKQTRARAIDTQQPLREIVRALRFLGQPVPEAGLATGASGDTGLQAVWAWAIARWDRHRITAQRTITVNDESG